MKLSDMLFANAMMGEGGGGGGSAPLIVNIEEEGTTWTLDKTWAEINAAMNSGVVYVTSPDGYYTNFKAIVSEINYVDGVYSVVMAWSGGSTFSTNSENGYPHVSWD